MLSQAYDQGAHLELSIPMIHTTPPIVNLQGISMGSISELRIRMIVALLIKDSAKTLFGNWMSKAHVTSASLGLTSALRPVRFFCRKNLYSH